MSQVRNITLPLLLMLSIAAPANAQDAAAPSAPAANTPPPLSAYGLLPAIEDADLSNDGSRSAVARTRNGRREIVALDANGKTLATMPLSDQKLDGVRWAGNDLLLITVRRSAEYRDGRIQELPLTYIFNVSARTVTEVFGHRDDIYHVTAGTYGIKQIKGRWYGYFGGFARSGQRNLYQVDLESGATKRVVRAGTYSQDMDWIIDENGALIVTLTEEANGEWRIANGDGKVIKTGQLAADRSITLAGLSPDGGAVLYFTGGAGEENYRVHEIALTDGQAVATPSAPSDAEMLMFDDATLRLTAWGTADVGALPTRINADENRIIEDIAAANPDKIVRLADYSDDFGVVLFRAEGPGDAGTWYRYDAKTKTTQSVGSERPGISAAQVGDIRVIEYTAQDGLAMEMIVTLPPGREPKNLPVIMLPHGGPHSHDEPVFDYWAQALASRGYVVVQPNFRGSTDQGRKFMRAGYGEWGGKMQTDISDALNHLAGLGMVDPNRACIVGASYGGYAALAGVTLQQGLYKCAVSVAGVSDLPMLVRDDLNYTGNDAATRRYYKLAVGEGRDLKMLSPATFAERADAPVLLIHGRADSVVYLNQSERMRDRLEDAGKPVEFVLLEGEDHWLSRGETRLAMLEAVVAFVEKHNPAVLGPPVLGPAGVIGE